MNSEFIEKLRAEYGDRTLDRVLGYCLADDVAFRVAIRRHPDLVYELIRPFMGGRSFEVVRSEIQKPLGGLMGKTVILDAWIALQGGEQVGVEVQVDSSRFPPERALFYSAALTTNALPKGAKDYRTMRPSLLLIFTTWDVLGHGQGVYDYAFRESNGTLMPGNCPRIVYANTEFADESSEAGSLALDLFKKDPDDIRNAIAKETLNELKYDEGGLTTMCLEDNVSFRDGHSEGRAEGLKEGRAEGLKEGFKEGRLLAIAELFGKEIITLEQALVESGASEEEIRRLAKEVKA